MKILILMGLSSRLVESQIRPIIKHPKIEKLNIIRDDLGPKLPKVKYFYPSKFLTKTTIRRIFSKTFLALKLISKTKSDMVLAFYLVPHGIIGFLGAKLKCKPFCISLLGTDLNVHCRRKVIGKILIWMIKHSDFITVPGSISKKILIDNGVRKDMIYILPNTIDTQHFKRLTTIKKYELITIGRLVKIKHIEILLKTVIELKRRHRNLKVGIAGSGPLKSDLEKLATELNLEKNVEFLGFVDDASQFLNSGKIYVLTSESEGLPTAMVEAMACGIPCVVSNVGNISDVVINGKNSLIIDDYSDVDGYVNAVSKLLRDKKLYQQISHNALEVRKKYSVKNATEVWKKIFDKLQLS